MFTLQNFLKQLFNLLFIQIWLFLFLFLFVIIYKLIFFNFIIISYFHKNLLQPSFNSIILFALTF
jgi:hypothetical protein